MNIIQVNALKYHVHDTVILNGLDLTVASGKIVGIIGDQGAGKTTLLQILSTVKKPTAGIGTILGKDISYIQDNDSRSKIGYVPQTLGLCGELSVLSMMKIFSELYPVETLKTYDIVAETLRSVHLMEQKCLTVNLLTKKQKLFLGIGVSIIHQPLLLLVDEPSLYLRADERLEFLQLLQSLVNNGITVILASQSIADGYYCDEVFLLHQGVFLASGGVETLCHSVPYKIFEICLSELAEKKVNDEIHAHCLASYLSGRQIRVIARPGQEPFFLQAGFYKTEPRLEDVKWLYESR